MTTGPENLGNGAAKTEDRFAGQLGYRPRATRDGGSLPPAAGPLGGGPLVGGPRGGNPGNAANPSNNNHSGGSVSPINGGIRGTVVNSRNASPLGVSPLDGVGDDFGNGLERMTTPLDVANPIASTLTQPKLDDAVLHEPSLPDVGYRDNGYRDPAALSVDPWLDGPGHTVADHPLLRGLLLELPPKGSRLQAQWLERWFEAARSILELLYRFEGKRD